MDFEDYIQELHLDFVYSLIYFVNPIIRQPRVNSN